MTTISKSQIIEYLNPAVEPAIKTVDGPQELGKDAFMKLLITQMQNQDPLNPMEGVEFTAQLAQFSSLEQLSNLNTSFSGINAVLQAQNNYQAINMVGKEIRALGDTLSIQDGESTGGVFVLEETAADTTVHIYDEDGLLVRTLDMGSVLSGEQEIEWDGKDNQGDQVEDGLYSFEVTALDQEGQPVTSTSVITGTVSGVTFDSSNQAWLLINGLAVSMSQVLEINAPSQKTAEETVS
ncbi:MAG: flagellar hook capping FlgD N-terminal domain-containing protein [Pseudomonadota bacterium]